MRIVNVHNKLRFISFLQCLGLLVYVVLPITVRNSSWMHGVHVIVQPVLFISTLYNHKLLAQVAWLFACAAFAVDVLVASINLLVITRCADDINPSCVQRVGASVVWLALALLHCVFSFFSATAAYRAYELVGPRIVFENIRIRTVCWFLFAQDSAYTLLTSPSGLEWLTLLHPLVNFFGVWVSYRTTRDTAKLYVVFGVCAVVLMALDIYGIQQVWQKDTFEDDLAALFYGVYLFTDLLLVLFSAAHVSDKQDNKQE